MHAIYLHGFASTGDGAKGQAHLQRFGSSAVVAPDLPERTGACQESFTSIALGGYASDAAFKPHATRERHFRATGTPGKRRRAG